MPPDKQDSTYLRAAEYERRHGELVTKDSQLEASQEDHERRISRLEDGQEVLRRELQALQISFNALQTRIGIYAAGGALAGGGIVSIIVAIISKWLLG